MATPTNPLAGVSVQQIADMAAAQGASAAQIQGAANTAGVSVQTPVPTAPQNTQTITPPSGGINTQPTQQQTAIQNVTQGSAAWEQMKAQGFTDAQISAAQQSLMNKANGTAGVVQAPAQQQTPAQQQPTQQTQTNQEPNYMDDSEARLTEIAANLGKFYAESPSMFTTIDDFKRNFKYNQRSAEQRAVLDNFYAQIENTRTQGSVSNAWTSISNQDIVQGAVDGNITEADLQGLMLTDPVRYAAIKSEIDKARNYADANDTVAGIKKTLADLGLTEQSTIPDLQAEYDAMLGTEEITGLRDTLTTKKGEIDALDNEISNLRSDLEEEFSGSGLSRSRLEAIIADKTESLNKQRNALTIGYNTELNRYNGLVSEATNRFSLIEKQYALEQQQRQQKMQELGFAMDFMAFETPAQADERAWQTFIRQETFKTGDINSTDPTIRKKAVSSAVDTVLAEFAGIPIQRSREQIIDDIQKLVDSGMSLGNAITQNLRAPIMSKPEYQYRKAKNLGIEVGITKVGDVTYKTNPDGSIEVVNGGVGTTVNGGFTNFNPVDINTVVSRVGSLQENFKTGDFGGECGEFVNNYLGTMGIGKLFGNLIEEKLGIKNSNTPEIGSVAIIDRRNNPNATDKQRQYGHVGVVTAINGDKVTVMQSNNNDDKKVFTQDYTTGQISGYFDPKKKASSDLNIKGLSANALSAYNSKAILGSPTQASKIEAELQNAGVFDVGEGNINLYRAKDVVRNTDLPNILNTLTEWEKARGIINELDNKGKLEDIVGWLNGSLTKAKIKTNIAPEEVAALQSILGKNLSAYMMKVSGATVPAEEVERLSQQIPNLTQGYKQFMESVKIYQDSMENLVSSKMTEYGFSDRNIMSMVLLKRPFTTGTATVNPYESISTQSSYGTGGLYEQYGITPVYYSTGN